MRYIHVKVLAGVNKESFLPNENKKDSGDYFEACVKEKAKNNMANDRVVELVASYFKVPSSSVRIVNGHRHPSKLLVVEE